jgi:hypothetical protein
LLFFIFQLATQFQKSYKIIYQVNYKKENEKNNYWA